MSVAKALLNDNWDSLVQKVVNPLWIRFEIGYKSIGFDYDDFLSLAGISFTKAFETYDASKSNIYTYAQKVLISKARSEIRDWKTRDKRKANCNAVSTNETLDDEITTIEDMIEDDRCSQVGQKGGYNAYDYIKLLNDRQKTILILKLMEVDDIPDIMGITRSKYIQELKKMQNWDKKVEITKIRRENRGVPLRAV